MQGSRSRVGDVTRFAASFALALALGVGCSSGADVVTLESDGGGATPIGADGATPAVDGGAGVDDAGVSPPAKDAGSSPPVIDGGSAPPPPDAGSASSTRNGTCTPLSKQTGKAVDTSHGRLDGTLVYVLPIDGSGACNGDSAHVHLQVEVQGLVYDVAVDIGKAGDEVGWLQKTMAVPGGAWSEGWHGSDALGYRSVGLTSGAFTTLSPSNMGAEIESLLAATSKISIYCTGYTPGDNGCHDVHYQDGTSQDGAIVLDPTSPTSPILFFRFTSQSF